MTSFGTGQSNPPKMASISRPKGRENTKNVLCRNMTLSGTCRIQGCLYNHDGSRFESSNDTSRRFLNVDSPSFTPLAPTTNTHSTLGISPKAAAAAVFTPKTAGNLIDPEIHALLTSPVVKPVASQSDPHDIPEFIPQQRYADFQDPAAQFDFAHQDLADDTHPQLNPYSQDHSAPFMSNNTYAHPLNYHLYAPVGPHKDNLLTYQRTVHDLFISDHLREELQRKAEATLQTFANSTLPQQVDHFHSLVLLDTNINKARSVSGYVTRLYKAVSSKDGYTYCLRRLEGFRLTDEKAVSTIQTWKRIDNGSLVTVHDAFTTRAFGDSSLIVVTDYHPLSQTLAERLFAQTSRPNNGRHPVHVPISELWSYLVQLASAIQTIHSMGLAARLVSPARVLLTSKNRVRLNACGVLDIAHYDAAHNMADLQAKDLVQLGQTILCIATKNMNAQIDTRRSIDQAAHIYGDNLRHALSWLITLVNENKDQHNIDAFLVMISSQVLSTLDASLHQADDLTSTLSRELENSRLVRLLTKLDCILERPDSSPSNNSINHTNNSISNSWSETGERYYLKLFRDYVFHQVDSEGRPVLDLGHIIVSLNRLDAGIDEKVLLVSRDEQNCLVVSYRELKRGFESAWNELLSASSGNRRL